MSTGAARPETADILVVDDAPVNLKLLCKMLRTRGFQARPVTSGAQALQAARHLPPDLILLDINMPEMNGYEVCEQLKADPKLQEVPVIFISALSEPLDKVRAFGAGGVDYVVKPFQFEEVEARVRTHLELRRQRRELERSHARLRSLEEFRDSLVHMVVHDLRNPLQVVYSLLEVLQSKEPMLSERGKEYAGLALEGVASLFMMINAILDVSKIEGGALTLDLASCDVAALAREVLEKCSPSRPEGRPSCEAAEGPLEVRADRELLRRVILNLVDNAARYASSPGSVHVSIQSAGNAVRLSVRDDGPGIPEEYRERIFEKFGQVELQGEGRKYSAGLGLTFCKLAIEAHGGRIEVESQVGRGSTFWFELPRHVAP